MRSFHGIVLGNVVSLLGLPMVAAWAQTGAPAPSPAPVASDGTAAGIVVAVAILALLVIIGGAVALHDMKRKHEDEAAALQGLISDALLTDRSLSRMVITPRIQMASWRSGLVTVIVTGAVPTPELREAAIQLVTRKMEESRMSFCIEDRVLVDPMVSRRAA
jgi:hypothetical protein